MGNENYVDKNNITHDILDKRVLECGLCIYRTINDLYIVCDDNGNETMSYDGYGCTLNMFLDEYGK